MKKELKGLDDLEEDKELSLNKILASLIKKEDIELKTEILRPMALSGLNIFSGYLNGLGFEGSSALISDFIEVYLEYMVSYNRKGREEIIRGIRSLLDREKEKLSLSAKLTSNLT